MKYFYFHGYGSSPDAKKCQVLKNIFGEGNVVAPDFNKNSIKELHGYLSYLIRAVKSEENPLIIGSSLGGLYALYVSARANAKCILLNPCLAPQLVVPKITTDIDVEQMLFVQKLSMEAYGGYNPENVRVWVTKSDKLIDHKTLTKPYFARGVAEYKRFTKSKDNAYGHEFKGFKRAVIKNLVNKEIKEIESETE